MKSENWWLGFYITWMTLYFAVMVYLTFFVPWVCYYRDNFNCP